MLSQRFYDDYNSGHDDGDVMMDRDDDDGRCPIAASPCNATAILLPVTNQ